MRTLAFCIFLSIIANSDGQLQPGSPWPMANHDAQNTGFADKAVVNQSLGYFFYPSSGSAVIDIDGSIIVNGYRHLMSISGDGSTRWSVELQFYVSPPVISAGGAIYVAGYPGRLLAFDRAGQSIWTFQAGDEIPYSPAIGVDGRIYFAASDGKAYCVNPDGTLSWSVDIGGFPGGACSIDDQGVLYFPLQNGVLVAVTPAGAISWSLQTPSDISISTAIRHDGALIVAGRQDYGKSGFLAAIRPDGNVIWQNTVTHSSATLMIGPDDTIYSSGGSFLYAYDTAGHLKWSVSVGLGPIALRLGPRGRIYCGPWLLDSDGRLIGHGAMSKGADFVTADGSLSDGRGLWHQRGDVTWSSSSVVPTISGALGRNGRLYCTTADNNLTALDADNRILWQTKLVAPRSVWVGADDTAYVFGMNRVGVTAVDDTGKVRWKFNNGVSLTYLAGLSNGTSIFSDHNHIYAESLSGTALYTFSFSPNDAGAVLGEDGLLYVCPTDGRWIAIRPEDGSILSTLTFPAPISAGNVLRDGSSYLTSRSGTLYHLESDQSVGWQIDLAPGLEPQVAPDGTIYLVAPHSSNPADLYCINADGSLRWETTIPQEVEVPPLIAPDGTVYVWTRYTGGSYSSLLYSFKPDGTPILVDWRISPSATFGFDEGLLVLFDQSGNLIGLRPDGAAEWAIGTAGTSASWIGRRHGNFTACASFSGIYEFRPWTRHVTGQVGRENLTGLPGWETLQMTLHEHSRLGPPLEFTHALSPEGSFDAWVPPSVFDLTAKTTNWLAKRIDNLDTKTDDRSGVQYPLANGDANFDNAVNIKDLNSIFVAFGTSDADIDRDGATDLADLTIIVANFGLIGDD